MRSITLPVPAFGFVVATRAALGVGLGLLLADRLPRARRQIIGRTLVAVGALTTIPALATIRRSFRRRPLASRAVVQQNQQLIGATRYPRKGDDDIV